MHPSAFSFKEKYFVHFFLKCSREDYPLRGNQFSSDYDAKVGTKKMTGKDTSNKSKGGKPLEIN